MHRTPFAWLTRGLFAGLVVVALGFVAASARADSRTEKEAEALQQKAVQEDFLNMDYPSAIKKLRTALNKCGANNCNASVRASLRRDLGAMLILGGAAEEGQANFAQAVGLDPSLELDPAYKNPKLEAAWEAAKKGGGEAGGGGDTTTSGNGGGGRASQPSGDFTHSPVAEQAVRTPVPVYVEYSGGETLKKVVIKYKGAQMSDWKHVDLKSMGDGWGGLIPCKDVTQGKMQYYVQGFNAANDPVATGASKKKPYTVPIKQAIEGPEPSLPGQDPPKQCGELAGAECPPDFPGCKNKKASGEDCDKNADCTSNSCVGGKCAEKKEGGDDCEKDDECASGSCSDGKCTAPKKGSGEDCDTGDDCASGTCNEGRCEGGGGGGAGGPYKKFWGGVSVAIDLFLMPAADNVCVRSTSSTQVPSAGPAQAGNPYTCYDPTFNANFPGGGAAGAALNSAIDYQDPQSVRFDFVNGGFAHGPLTLSVSFDYALNPNMLLGARAGYELLTYPGTASSASVGPAFPPFRLEARYSYLLGENAINKPFALMFFGGLGIGEFDAYVPTSVYFKSAPPPPVGCASGATGTCIASGTLSENAWLTAGPFFANVGGGIRIALGGDVKNVAIPVLLKVEGAFGGTAGFLWGVAPEVGFQYGF